MSAVARPQGLQPFIVRNSTAAEVLALLRAHQRRRDSAAVPVQLEQERAAGVDHPSDRELEVHDRTVVPSVETPVALVRDAEVADTVGVRSDTVVSPSGAAVSDTGPGPDRRAGR